MPVNRPKVLLRLVPALLFLALLAPVAASANPRPAPAAIAYWKSIVLKPSHLPPYWRGYLNGANLDTCRLKHGSGIVFCNCHVQSGGTVLAFVSLVRTSRCKYAYVMASTRSKRSFTRTFRYC